MGERNLNVDHVTIWRWVRHLCSRAGTPQPPELRLANCSWRTDETRIRVAGKWTYFFRAVDSMGTTIDFLLSENREARAAKRFFQKA